MAKTQTPPETGGDGADVSNQTPAVQHHDTGVDHAPAQVVATTPKLTTRTTAEFGAKGRFLDATAEHLAAAPEGLLVDPTPEQLARRRT